MKPAHQEIVDETLEEIDHRIEPEKMKKREALAVLEELIESLEVRADALREDIEDGDDDE